MSNGSSKRPTRFLRSIARYPMRSYLLWTAAAGLLSLLLYWIVRSGYWPTALSGNEASSALVDMLLGPAISLSGALVAILLAVYAIRLQERQQHREALQAQVEMLRLVAEQTAPFLQSYSRMLSHVRSFLANLEVAHYLFSANAKDPEDPVELAGIGEPLMPVVRSMNHELVLTANLLDELAILANSDAFTSAIVNDCLAGARVHLISNGSDAGVPLRALPTLAVWLRYVVGKMEAMIHKPEGPQLLAQSVHIGRSIANGYRNKNGEEIRNGHVKSLIMSGTMWDASLANVALDKDFELRPPLLEIFAHLTLAINGPSMEQALGKLFKENDVLQPVLDKLGDVLPTLMDPSTVEYFEVYMNERPRFRMKGGKVT